MLSMEQVEKVLKRALRAKDRRKVIADFVKYGFSQVTPEGFREAVESDLDLAELIISRYNLTSPAILPLFRAVMRLYWPEFEEVVTNVPAIYSLLSKDPEMMKVLEDDKAKDYLNRQCENLYKRMYELVWSD